MGLDEHDECIEGEGTEDESADEVEESTRIIERSKAGDECKIDVNSSGLTSTSVRPFGVRPY